MKDLITAALILTGALTWVFAVALFITLAARDIRGAWRKYRCIRRLRAGYIRKARGPVTVMPETVPDELGRPERPYCPWCDPADRCTDPGECTCGDVPCGAVGCTAKRARRTVQ